MRVYRDLELVEQLGSGMNRILQAYPKDVFRFSDNFMEVCFTFDEEYVPAEQVAGQDDEKPAGNTLDNFGKNSERIRKQCGAGF